MPWSFSSKIILLGIKLSALNLHGIGQQIENILQPNSFLSTFNGPEYEIISETEANHYTPCKDCQTNVPPAKYRVEKRAPFEDRAPCKIEA